MANDYYDLLGVNRNANKDDIKRAFRKMARQFHPDVNQSDDSAKKFKSLNEAYEVLSDDAKRARYDRFGHAGVSGMSGAPNANGFGGIEDIFEDLLQNFGGFNRRRSPTGPAPGGDRRLDVKISFEEAVLGVEITGRYERLEYCDRCSGSGAAPGTKTVRCVECRGSGELRQLQNTFLGSMVRVATCHYCNGQGERITSPCSDCSGDGRRSQLVSKTYSIPGGVREGTKIQFREEGDVGDLGAPRGNLYLVVHVKPHQYFKRDENNIIIEIPINVAQAALGDKIVVPIVGGEEREISVQPGTQTGKSFRMRGLGFPQLRLDGTSGGRGDQIVYIQVLIPNQLNEKQTELFKELGKSLGKEIQPLQNGRGFFDRMREFFTGEAS